MLYEQTLPFPLSRAWICLRSAVLSSDAETFALYKLFFYNHFHTLFPYVVNCYSFHRSFQKPSCKHIYFGDQYSSYLSIAKFKYAPPLLWNDKLTKVNTVLFCWMNSILFTKSWGYSNIINHSIYRTNVINLKQLILISQVIKLTIWINCFRIYLVTCSWDNHI